MTSKYSALDRIGISEKEALKIRRYSLRQQGNSDILKIYFYRKPNEFLSHNRKYVFKRISKRVLVDGGKQIYEGIFEISPFVADLLKDLTVLETKSEKLTTGKEKILEDLVHLKRVVDQKIDEIKTDLDILTK